MGLNNSELLLAALVVTVLLVLEILRRKLGKWLERIEEETECLKKTLQNRQRQQQVIYNLSTSIFLLSLPEEVIKSAIEEVRTMYFWKEITYFPMPVGALMDKSYGEITGLEATKAEDYFRAGLEQVNFDTEGGRWVGVFPVGRKGKLWGILCASNNGQLNTEQTLFFRTIASILTVAIENNQVESKR